MAVYYKWIKGCASGANLSEGLWTYIKWGSGDANEDPDLHSVSNLPILYANLGKTDTPSSDLGYLLTNKALGITIEKDWIFNKTIFTNKIQSINNTDEMGIIAKQINISGEVDVSNGGIHVQGDILCDEEVETKTLSSKLGISNENGNIEITTKGDIYTQEGNIYATKGNIYTNDGYCKATYFNATSDKRAKENIQPATYNALSLIEKLPIYTYNYINDKDVVTGILAQDLLQVQPKELNLVSNTNATGENNDYMSIKNDKLMFVLMKAIQEQQEEIKQLKIEIEKLKNK